MNLLRNSVRGVVICTGLALLLLLPGCGGGKVGPYAYDVAKALITTCNLEDEARLETIAEMIDAAKEQQQLAPHEADRLMAIVERARDGQWKSAEHAARRILSDQIQCQ